MRLFLAIDLPENIQDQVTNLQCPELEQVRWSKTPQLHITLVFLGEQPEASLDEIIEAVSEISFEPFELYLSQIDHFRSGIIWLGVEGCEPLQRLQKSLSHKIRQLGISLEQRKYTPHITLGRCKQITPDILEAVAYKALGFNQRFTVDSFQLKSSVLRADGAAYTTEGSFYPD